MRGRGEKKELDAPGPFVVLILGMVDVVSILQQGFFKKVTQQVKDSGQEREKKKHIVFEAV